MVMSLSDLRYLRSEAPKTFADLCDFLTLSRVQDGQGGATNGDWITTSTSIPCRIVQASGREAFLGDAKVTDDHYTLTVSYDDGLTLWAGMRVRFEGHQDYEVEFTNELQDLRSAGRALLRRIS